MPARISAADIENELRRLGTFLRDERTFTLFGGCSMSVQGFKDTTKDADAIVEPPTRYGDLQEDLGKAGFAWLENEAMRPYELPAQRREVGGWDPYWRGEFTIDLFHPRRIFDQFSFSPAMRTRATSWFNSGRLQVRLADASTVFLLKSITGRWRNEPGRDIEDLQTLLDRGVVDVDWLHEEWRRQVAHVKDREQATVLAREALEELRRRGYSVAWTPS